MRGLSQRWQWAIVAAAGAVLLGLTTPPGIPPEFIWVAMVPMVWVARGLRPDRVREALVFGSVGGLGIGLLGFGWIALTLTRFAQLPMWAAGLGLLAFSIWTALPYGLWTLGMVRGPREGWRAVLWPAVLWASLSAWWPAVFPYTPVLGLAQSPVWIQAAEIGGVPLVEACVVATSVLLADAIRATGAGRRRRIAIGVAIPLVVGLGGWWRMAALDAQAADARRVRFGVVQPNTALFMRDREEKVRRLQDASKAAQDEGAEIIVWPEAGVFPYTLPRPYERDRSGRGRVLEKHRVPTILGVATRAEGAKYRYNSLAAMEADGRVTGVFDKTILVPFGEYIPIVDPDWARSYVPAMSHNFAGAGPARLGLHPHPVGGELGDAVHFGPLICYEDIFADFARRVAAQAGGIELFVNVTIDTWFGDTKEPWEHLALAQFRSVEHRIPMVRSVSAGTSSIVDHNGRLVAWLEVTDPQVGPMPPAEHLVHDVILPRSTTEQPTIYALGGWLLLWGCHAVVLGAVALVVWRARRRGSASGPQMR